jgi:hypothetical protein
VQGYFLLHNSPDLDGMGAALSVEHVVARTVLGQLLRLKLERLVADTILLVTISV